jgi:MYXO-CTERM domain-containing protein
VEGSTDGGKTWVALDTVEGSAPDWRIRQVTLDGLVDTTGQLIVRFVANNTVETTAVEAGIDDLSITTLTAECKPRAGTGMLPKQSSGGCDMGGTAPTGLFALLFLAGALLLRRRWV